jgi:hypothetical protein
MVSLALTLSACGDAEGSDAAPAGSASSGEVPFAAAGSCAETYDVETLTGRDFAFDGTVVEIGSAAAAEADLGYSPVTFDVHEWFVGGSSDRVTVAMPAPDRVSSDGVQGLDDATYGVGTRLLVSGEPQWGGEPLDDPIAWMCGFTRYYDDQSATQWRTAFTP